VQIYENTSNIPKKRDKKLRFYGFLGYSNTLLVIIARGKREKGTWHNYSILDGKITKKMRKNPNIFVTLRHYFKHY